MFPLKNLSKFFKKKFNDNCTRYSGFIENEFRDLLNIAISNTYFFFNKLLYKQVDGLAMGNPAAPALAYVFLCHIEEKIFSTCPKEFLPLKYARYLDDSFAVFSHLLTVCTIISNLLCKSKLTINFHLLICLFIVMTLRSVFQFSGNLQTPA